MVGEKMESTDPINGDKPGYPLGSSAERLVRISAFSQTFGSGAARPE